MGFKSKTKLKLHGYMVYISYSVFLTTVETLNKWC